MIGRTVVRQYTKSARESTYVEFRRLSRTMASLAESDALSCKINGIFIINIYSTSFWMNPRLIQHLSKQFDVFIKLIYRTDRHQCFTRRQLRANECYPTLGHDSSNGQDLGRSDWPWWRWMPSSNFHRRNRRGYHAGTDALYATIMHRDLFLEKMELKSTFRFSNSDWQFAMRRSSVAAR